MSSRSHQGFRRFSTTADVGIVIWADDFTGLLHQSVRGMQALLFGRAPRERPAVDRHTLQCPCDSRENALVLLLQEVLYVLSTRRSLVVGLQIHQASPRNLAVDLLLAPVVRPLDMEIKAVTYHGLRVRREHGCLRAAVIFDV